MTLQQDALTLLLDTLAERLAVHLRDGADLPTGGMTKEQAVKELGVNRTHVENLMADGAIAFLRVGKRIVISRASVEELLRTGGDFSHLEQSKERRGRAAS